MVREPDQSGPVFELKSGDYWLAVEEDRGGSVAAFEWAGKPVFRAASPGPVINTACFPLVPFSNRIAAGKFAVGDDSVHLAMNCAEVDQHHPLHGYGWLSEWEVVERSEALAVIEHSYAGKDWPWPYRARQHFDLGPDGLLMTLDVTNLGDRPMPTGLGFHPYFPRRADTVYLGLHRGEWVVDDDCLPVSLIEAENGKDWWQGQPVANRNVDTVYTGREGPIVLRWPVERMQVTLTPSDNLPFTVVYTPEGEDYVCIEPVSHSTDAINRRFEEMILLDPSDAISASMHVSAKRWKG